MKLSEHFSLDEFTRSQTASRRGISNDPSPEHITKMIDLCENVMDPIREHFGPVFISSGYRSRRLNEAIGGSQFSQHSYGEACDFVINGQSTTDICEYVLSSGIEFDQLIDEGTWVHISYKHGKNRGEVLTAVFQAGQPTTYERGLTNA